MLSEIIGLAVLSFATAFITNIYYSPFYKHDTFPMLVLLAFSVVLLLCLILPYQKKRGFFIKPFMSAMAFILLLAITYNAFFALAIIAFSLIAARLCSKKTKRTSIVFTSSNEPVKINYYAPVRLGSVLRKSHIFLVPLTLILVFVTFSYNIPHPLWAMKLFPVSECESTAQYDNVFVSGDVTECVAYNSTVMLVDDFFDIELPDGTKTSPCKEAGLLKGDVITHINNTPALSSDFIAKGPTGDTVSLTVNRFSDVGDVSTLTISVTPVFSQADDAYRLGITYYNAPLAMTSTIQTMTFVLPESGYFAATAHHAEHFSEGEDTAIMFSAAVTGSDDEGLTAQAGEAIGISVLNTNYGTFGVVENPEGRLLPIAKKNEVRLGKATLLSAFEGGKATEYEIYITGTYRIDEKDVFCIAATDERIQDFGGVMRGMSGTPVLQNGKIVGALCNVDANGFHAYAVFASDMADVLFENEKTLSESVNKEIDE